MRYLWSIFGTFILLILMSGCSNLPGVFNPTVFQEAEQAAVEGYEAIVDKEHRQEHLHLLANDLVDTAVEAAEGMGGLPVTDPNVDLFKK
jgi:hypothetical protein